MKFVTFSVEQRRTFYAAINDSRYDVAVELIRRHKVTELTFVFPCLGADEIECVLPRNFVGFALSAPNLPEIQTLNLGEIVSTSGTDSAVADFLDRCPNVTSVRGIWGRLASSGVTKICRALERLPRLTSLLIERANLVDIAAPVLARLLEAKADTLTELVLTGVDINVHDVPTLCGALSRLTKLNTFHFSHRFRSDAAVLSALTALPNLTTVWMGNHYIDPARLDEFCAFLKARSSLTSLGLNISLLDDDGAKALLACCTHLTDLTLTIRPGQHRTVFAALRNITQLEVLFISSPLVDCTSDNVKLFVESLGQLSRLREMYVEVGISHADTDQYLMDKLKAHYEITEIRIEDADSHIHEPSTLIAWRNRHYQRILSQLSQLATQRRALIQTQVIGGDSHGAAFDVVDLCNLFNSTQLLFDDDVCKQFSAERMTELQNHYLLLVTQFLMRCFYEIEIETTEMPLTNTAFLALEKTYRGTDQLLKLATAALAQITPNTSFHAMACYAIGMGCQQVAMHTKGPTPLRATVLKFFSECQTSTAFQQHAEEDERAEVIHTLTALATPNAGMTLINADSGDAAIELTPVSQKVIDELTQDLGLGAVPFPAIGEKKNLANIGDRLVALLRPAIDAEVDVRSKQLATEREAAEAKKRADEKAARAARYEGFLVSVNPAPASAATPVNGQAPKNDDDDNNDNFAVTQTRS